MRVIFGSMILTYSATRFCFGVLAALYQQRPVSVFTVRVVGKDRQCFDLKIFKAGNRALENTDLWFHYLKGNIDLVGPKALDPDAAYKLNAEDSRRFDVAPGMVTPHQVRQKSGMGHDKETTTSCEFAAHPTWLRRTQILLAAGAQWVLGNRGKGLSVPASLSLFGVSVDNLSMQQAVSSIVSELIDNNASNDGASDTPTNAPPLALNKPTKKMAFVNVDCVNKYVKNPQYQRALNQCHRVFADGIGIRIAARWHGSKLMDNVNGTDLFPILCQQLSSIHARVFLYGGAPDVVKATATKLEQEYPGVIVVGALDGYSKQHTPDFVCEQINQRQADLVFVALGAPNQEQWINDHANKLTAKVAIGVGGLFDFYSGHVSRAPVWLRELSMEWVWRLMMQPKDKAKRYLVGNPEFLARLFFSSGKTRSQTNVLEVF